MILEKFRSVPINTRPKKLEEKWERYNPVWVDYFFLDFAKPCDYSETLLCKLDNIELSELTEILCLCWKCRSCQKNKDDCKNCIEKVYIEQNLEEILTGEKVIDLFRKMKSWEKAEYMSQVDCVKCPYMFNCDDCENRFILEYLHMCILRENSSLTRNEIFNTFFHQVNS